MTRIRRTNGGPHGGVFWSSLPVSVKEKLPPIPRYDPVPEPATIGTAAVTWK